MKTTDLFSLKGKVAIVTGASSGLGVIFAEALGDMGANIELAARRVEKLNDVAGKLKMQGAKTRPFQCDVSKQEEVQALVDDTVKNFGRLDIIVNNAGIAAMSPATDISVDEWNKVVSVNMTGVFLCARTAARQMIKQSGGNIVNIASIYGAVGDVFPASPYYATKGAVINMTRDLAVEWAPYNIRVNAIAPGFFPSEMTEAIFQQPEYLEYIRKQTPLGRPGNLDDLKGAIVYLASSASAYVTGQTIFVDGGWTAW
ncbi:MAG TPA: glucose 1-dehydrogenase [Candidatus Bathyarchaeia archaeon]|nr:glucose 1-dehydrogenase [Candidatus Bathyarchaeia archaeon]